MSETKYEKVLVADLIPYARNAKKHPQRQVDKIAASIKEFGFLAPVLIDEANGILAGHGRVLAAQKLKLGHVPCIRAGHLSETQKRAFILADNRIAEDGEYDEQMLALEMAEIREADFDALLTGFDEKEIDKLLTACVRGEDEPFVPHLPDEDEGDSSQKKFVLTVTLDSILAQEILFSELNERGFKVKAAS